MTLQCPFPQSTSPSLVPSSEHKSHSNKKQNYGKLRWRKVDPTRKRNADSDKFISWRPPADDIPDEHQAYAEQASAAIGTKDSRQYTPASDVTHASTKPAIVKTLSPGSITTDPCLILPIRSTEVVYSTLDYFVTICKGLNNVADIENGTVNPHLSLLLPFALQHAILFESIIALCRASVLIALGCSIWDDQPFMQHRASAIAKLNDQIKTSDATDDAALLTVTMLMTLEYMCGNNKAVLMHCDGLSRMVELRGPSFAPESPWTKFVAMGLTAYRALGSFVTGQPPDIPKDSISYLGETFEGLHLDRDLEYPEPPFDSELCLVLSRLPRGLSDLCVSTQISVQMMNILASVSAIVTSIRSETVEYHNLLDGSWRPPLPIARLAETKISEYEQQRIQITMQTILSALQRMTISSESPIEQYVTSGTIAFCIQMRGLAGVNLFYDPMLRNFIEMFRKHRKSRAPLEQTCMIWCSMAAAGVLALRSSAMPGSHLVLDHALELYPQARSWPHLQKLLRTYLHTEEMLSHWKKVWAAAMARRQVLRRQQGQCEDNCFGRASVGELEVNQSTELDSAQSVNGNSTPHPQDLTSAALQAHIQKHILGAPKAMFQMSQTMGICPFRPQSGSGDGRGNIVNGKNSTVGT
jgi:hypothetical protein